MPSSVPPTRPDLLAWFFLAYASGILLAPYFHAPESHLVLITGVLNFLVFILFRRLGKYFLILFLAFCGFALYHLNMAPPESPGHIAHLGDEHTTLVGYVNSITPRHFGSLLDLEVTATAKAEGTMQRKGKIHLFIREGVPDIRPGDKIRTTAKLRRPQLYGVPGEFNYPRYLARKHVFVTGYLDSAERIVRLAGEQRKSLAGTIEGFRHSIRSFINANVPDMAPYLRALTIGDRGGLSQEEKSLLGRSGVSHLFAISGLHMGVLFLFFYGPLNFFYKRSEALLLQNPPRRVLPLGVAPLLFFYLFLAGAGLPTQRAFAVLIAGAVLLYWHYYTSPTRIAFSIAFLLILADPLALFSPSYQLSFAAVFAILFFAPKWQKRISRLPPIIRYPAVLLLVTCTATVATLPFVLFHFHVFPLSGILLNLICVPLVSFLALPCALGGAAFFSFSPFLGKICFCTSAMVLDLTLNFIKILTPPADSAWSTFYLNPFEIIALFLLIFAPFIWKVTSIRASIFGGTVIVICGLLIMFPRVCPKPFMLTAINVGHGDAMVLHKGDKFYLIDGGGSYNDNFDVGERLLAPALGNMGIKDIEAVILTHAHPDHFKGLTYILNHFRVREFWSAIEPARLPETIRIPLQRKGIPLLCFPEGWTTIQRETGNRFSIFVPKQSTPVVNDRSLVVYLKEGINSLLLTGDLEKDGVQQLLANTPYSKATLLKLPHHGSIHSQPRRLIEFFQPDTVFATTNRSLSARDYFPKPGNLRYIYSCTLGNSDEQASIRFVPGKDGWRVRYWQRGLFR